MLRPMNIENFRQRLADKSAIYEECWYWLYHLVPRPWCRCEAPDERMEFNITADKVELHCRWCGSYRFWMWSDLCPPT